MTAAGAARGLSLDPRQQLSEGDENALVALAAKLGYTALWTPATGGPEAFERCARWHRASGLPVGTNVVPASAVDAGELAHRALDAHSACAGAFRLGVGSGQFDHPVPELREYLGRLRKALGEAGPPVYMAALGPLMLRLAGELADGVALNWFSAERVAWGRRLVGEAARAAGRPAPVLVEYIRTAVDPDAGLARRTLGEAALQYALGPAAYRRHFERMGFAAELDRLEAEGGEPSDALLAAAGAHGAPGAVRPQFEALAVGLDEPIVRVLVTRPGDAESARRVIEECAPGR